LCGGEVERAGGRRGRGVAADGGYVAASVILRCAPGRGSSDSLSRPDSRNRRRHLPPGRSAMQAKA
jgi:hypothetical protein